MGYNTTVVVLNDALDQIENDSDFGKNLAAAVRKVIHGKPVDVSAGNHANAACVIETHHADIIVPVLVGGNYGETLGIYIFYKDDAEVFLMKELAKKHGYKITFDSDKSAKNRKV